MLQETNEIRVNSKSKQTDETIPLITFYLFLQQICTESEEYRTEKNK